MKKKTRTKNKRIVFGKQPLVVFSNFVTHPITGLTLEEITERVNFGFLEELAPPRKTRGRPPLPFVALCKMLFVLFCERLPSLTELSRRFAREKRLQEFCGFEKGKTPSKQKISQFQITLPKEKQKLRELAHFHYSNPVTRIPKQQPLKQFMDNLVFQTTQNSRLIQ